MNVYLLPYLTSQDNGGPQLVPIVGNIYGGLAQLVSHPLYLSIILMVCESQAPLQKLTRRVP